MKIGIKLIVSIFSAILFGSAPNSFADVFNGSGESVYVKPEDGSKPIEVKPGEAYKGQQDGVASKGKVTKNSDGLDLIVDKNGDVEILQKNPITRAVEALRAGELDESPDAGWDPIFGKAKEQVAEKEKAGREKAAREKAAREKAAREKAAREKAAREKAAREKAERERQEREYHERMDRHDREREHYKEEGGNYRAPF